MIKRIAILAGSTEHNFEMIRKKLNELAEAINGEEKEPRVLVCPHCGSEKWESSCRSTLMGGPMNYYTYQCKECGKETRVKRIRRTDPRVYLGPEDEVK